MNFNKKVKSSLSFKPACCFFKSGELLQVWKLATYAKFQLNISKLMPARGHRNTGSWSVNSEIGVIWQPKAITATPGKKLFFRKTEHFNQYDVNCKGFS